MKREDYYAVRAHDRADQLFETAQEAAAAARLACSEGATNVRIVEETHLLGWLSVAQADALKKTEAKSDEAAAAAKTKKDNAARLEESGKKAEG